MSLTKINYTKDWTNPTDFPTIETSEAQVRLDMQVLYDQTETGVNAIVDQLEATTDGASGADQIGATAISGIVGANVQAILESLKGKVDDTKTEVESDITAHTTNTNNPHSVTAAQVSVSATGIEATNVQGAIGELKTGLDTKLATATAAATYEPIATADGHLITPTWDSTLYQLKFYSQGSPGSPVLTVDLPIETMPNSMEFIEDPVGSGNYYLVIKDKRGQQVGQRVNVSALFNEITVENTQTIELGLTTLSSGKKKLTAGVIAGRIGATQLDPTFVSRVSTLESALPNYIKSKTDSDRIAITLTSGADGKTILADIIDHSIGATQIDSQYMTDINAAKVAAQTAKTDAETAAINANTYKTAAEAAKTDAETAATGASGYSDTSKAYSEVSEEYASGTKNGTPVPAFATTNSKYYSEQSAAQALVSSGYATTSGSKALVSEGWANGKQNGADVEPSSPYYHNNAKYWSDQARAAASGDMLKSVYDINNNGVVDDSEKLGGQLPAYYAKASREPIYIDASAVSSAPTAYATCQAKYDTNPIFVYFTLVPLGQEGYDCIYRLTSFGFEAGAENPYFIFQTFDANKVCTLTLSETAWGTPTVVTNAIHNHSNKQFLDGLSQSTLDAKADKSDLGTISLTENWTGSASPYTQTVTVSGATVTSNSKVDIQPSATMLAQLIDDGTNAMYVENNNGTLTVYAIGEHPTVALSNIQVLVTEVVS